MLLFQQMAVLFIFMILGFVCGKIKALSDEAAKAISWIVVNIANPALILSSGVNNDGGIKGMELLTTFGLAIAIFVVLILVSLVIPVILRVKRDDAGVYRVMTIFSNIGFMGFPVISAIYGGDALLYASLFLFPFNILIYTYGIMAMRKRDSADKMKFEVRKILNIGVIACILSIAIYLSGLKMPVVVKSSVTHLSNLTAPLSMIVIGQSLIHIKFKELFTDVRLLIFSAIKLIAIPIIGMLVLRMFIKDSTILGVCMIMLATPVGSMTAMLAQQYDGNYPLASKGVALTTVLSVGTIPLVSLLLNI